MSKDKPAPPEATEKRFPLASTLLLIWVFFMTFVARSVLSPLLLEVERALGISHAEGGALFLVISVGLITTMLLSGVLLQRMQHRSAIALSGVLAGVGLLILSVAGSLLPFRIGLFIIGAGAGLYLPSGMTTLTDVVSHRQWGRAIALHELGPIFGLASAPFLAELALRFANWRVLMAVLAGAAFASVAAFWFRAEGGSFRGTPPAWGAVGRLIRKPQFWVICILFIMALGLEMGVYSMLPTYLVDVHGLPRSMTNTVVSTSRLTSLLGVALSGWATDHIGFRRVLAFIVVTAGLTTTTLGLAQGGALLTAVYIQPMLISGFFPPGLAALAGVSSAKQRNLTISLVIPLAYLLGAGMIPAILGRLAERGSFGLGYVWVGAVMVATALFVPIVKRPAADGTPP
jgi:NNP family nitrate/nitrite transporter-like MFS transporter